MAANFETNFRKDLSQGLDKHVKGFCKTAPFTGAHLTSFLKKE